MNDITQLKEWIDQAKYVVFLGGAGVSTASGVPDFRSTGGLYQQFPEAEQVLTPRFLARNPERFYDFYRPYFMPQQVIEPNAAHMALARLEAMGKLDAVITQNVDGLHQKAGSQQVYALHGRADRFSCRECSRVYRLEQVQAMAHVPRCECGAVLRSDIVLFEESLNSQLLEQAVRAVSRADLLIIGGSSLKVYPVAGLPGYLKPGAKRVLINLEPVARPMDLTILRPIAEVFEELMALYPAS